MSTILPVFGTEDPNGYMYGIDQIAGQAVGAASVCWENMSGTGEFQSNRAKQILDELLENIELYVTSREPLILKKEDI